MGADANKIGSVQRIMIDKISGKVAYAVISFGGFEWAKTTIHYLGQTSNTTCVSAATASA
jgi:hypothetical protein